MSIRFNFIAWLALIIFSCNKQRDANATDEISGAYVREYSFKVINPENGVELGIRLVRDTIFIKPRSDKFEVSNRKWAKNDYDIEGWRSMEHSNDRPFSSFQATYQNEPSMLNCVGCNLKISIDTDNLIISVGNKTYRGLKF